jgi:signal transduction histidine kinase
VIRLCQAVKRASPRTVTEQGTLRGWWQFNDHSHSIDSSRKGENVAEQNLTPDEEIRYLKKQLNEAQKMAALGELVSTTTHEFNNVLMTVINYAKMGLRHADDETRIKSFTRILDAGERAAKITASILGMARNRSDELEPTDLAKLIEDALVLLEREMNKYRIHLDFSAADGLPKIMAIGNQLQQVILNLLINARQAMESGGEVVIKLTYDAAENNVVLFIRDNGSGMTQATLRQIFDPYFSTKNGPDDSGKGGTGLGLSACRDIIRKHSGRIRVKSSVGKGTAFTIMLPAVSTSTAPPVLGACAGPTAAVVTESIAN